MSFVGLITRSIEEGNPEYIQKINVGLLEEHEREVILYLREHIEDYGKLPTEEVFRLSEYTDYWTPILKGTTIKYLYEKTVERAVVDYVGRETRSFLDSFNTTGNLEIEELNKSIRKITTVKDVKRPISLGKVDRKKYYEADSSNRLYFGIPVIDYHTGGMKAGDYALMIAPTGVGKTTLTAITAVRAALGGNKVLYNPRETTNDEVMEIIDAILASFNKRIFRKTTDEDREALMENMQKVSDGWQMIYDAGGDIVIPENAAPLVTPKQIEEAIRLASEEGKPYDLVIVDGLYQMSLDGNNFIGDNWGAFASLSSQMMRLAKHGEVPTRILATSQVKPTFEERKFSFSLSDIGFARAIKNDYDFIIAMGEQDAGVWGSMIGSHEKAVFFNLLKNRQGSTNPTDTNTQAVFDYEKSQIRYDLGGMRLSTPMALSPLKVI